MKILLVDDDPYILRIVPPILERAGHKVTTFHDLEEAKKAVGGFDLVVTDGSVNKHRDGIAWAAQLKTHNTKVVILSGEPPVVGPKGVPFVQKGSGYKSNLLDAVKSI
ncbi:MAG: response regulator [Patescibacteria group bacterium]